MALLMGRQNNAVQVGASAEMRSRQANNAYRIIGDVSCDNEYMLLDDVWTTGSSMMAACELLKKNGARNVSVIVLAKSG